MQTAITGIMEKAEKLRALLHEDGITVSVTDCFDLLVADMAEQIRAL